MKVTLKADSKVTVNGIEMVLEKGMGVELPCQTKEHALELCSIAKLHVDFTYTEGGMEYVAGASGKFVARAVKKKAPKAEPKVTPEAPKAEVKVEKPKTKATK